MLRFTPVFLKTAFGTQCYLLYRKRGSRRYLWNKLLPYSGVPAVLDGRWDDPPTYPGQEAISLSK